MPDSIKHHLTVEAQIKRRREWADDVAHAWCEKRTPDTSEHFSKKGFTYAELVQLADLAIIADDIRWNEISKHGDMLPGPTTWLPGPEMWIIIQALYREFGFIVGFLEHARRMSAASFGFTGKHLKTLQLDVITPEGPRAKLTPSVARRFMRNPGFINLLIKQYGSEPGWKDVATLIQKIAPFSLGNVPLRNFASEMGRCEDSDGVPEDAGKDTV